jgi:ribosome-binding factor A
MKVLPELRFEQEDSEGGPDRIERLLRQLHEQEGA